MPRPNKGAQVRFRKDRNCWGVAEFVKGNLKWHATGCGSQQDAQRELARILISNDRNAGPCFPDDRLVKDVLSSYLLEHGPQTLRPDNLIYACEMLTPFWADLPVSAVTKATCQRYAAERRSGFKKKQEAANRQRIKAGKEPKPIKELSNASIRLELATLKAALRHDHQEGRLLHVPPLWLPSKPPSRDRWLTRQEAAKLLRAARGLTTAKDYLPLYILLALYTGARKDAVLSLRWPQIDFKREIIDFRTGGPASSKGRAIVPIPRRLLRELRKAKKRGTDLGYVVHVKKTVIRDGLETVAHERLGDIKKSFREACIRAGLKGVIPHTLRHTPASWMVQKGVPLFEVARYLGHTSTIMVEKTYGHMAPEHLRRAKESWG